MSRTRGSGPVQPVKRGSLATPSSGIAPLLQVFHKLVKPRRRAPAQRLRSDEDAHGTAVQRSWWESPAYAVTVPWLNGDAAGRTPVPRCVIVVGKESLIVFRCAMARQPPRSGRVKHVEALATYTEAARLTEWARNTRELLIDSGFTSIYDTAAATRYILPTDHVPDRLISLYSTLLAAGIIHTSR